MKKIITQINKKIFIAGKVYDLQVMDKDMVEASVQTYLDNAIGKEPGQIQAMHNRQYDHHVLPQGI